MRTSNFHMDLMHDILLAKPPSCSSRDVWAILIKSASNRSEDEYLILISQSVDQQGLGTASRKIVGNRYPYACG